MTKYMVIVTVYGYGKNGKPMREIMNEIVGANEIGPKLEDALMIGCTHFQADKRLTITVERI